MKIHTISIDTSDTASLILCNKRLTKNVNYLIKKLIIYNYNTPISYRLIKIMFKIKTHHNTFFVMLGISEQFVKWIIHFSITSSYHYLNIQ